MQNNTISSFFGRENNHCLIVFHQVTLPTLSFLGERTWSLVWRWSRNYKLGPMFLYWILLYVLHYLQYKLESLSKVEHNPLPHQSLQGWCQYTPLPSPRTREKQPPLPVSHYFFLLCHAVQLAMAPSSSSLYTVHHSSTNNLPCDRLIHWLCLLHHVMCGSVLPFFNFPSIY